MNWPDGIERGILFDVDGTLITFDDKPNLDVIELLLAFRRMGYEIGVWSGGGVDYAARWVERLGLAEHVSWVGAKARVPADAGVPWLPVLSIDDEPDADFKIPNLYIKGHQ